MEPATGNAILTRRPQSFGASERSAGTTPSDFRAKLMVRDLSFYYGKFQALKAITMDVPEKKVTAFIGPSGCGKSTLLRIFNRMYSLYPDQRAEGQVLMDGEDLITTRQDVSLLRAKIGMVFQKPTPFPMSIYDNIAFGVRLFERLSTRDMDERVEWALTRAALWGEVKDKLKQSGYSLSGGQQQRLCIARTIAVEPDVMLMDEPCSALDPIATARVEDLMQDLKDRYTIVIVTHNMQQAARASDRTVFLTMGEDRAGYVVETDETVKIFTNPAEQLTEDYISGRFG